MQNFYKPKHVVVQKMMMMIIQVFQDKINRCLSNTFLSFELCRDARIIHSHVLYY